MNKKAHLYAIKVLGSILLLVTFLILLAMYSPTILLWTIGITFVIIVFINLYLILYDVGKNK
jgi:hypothetical protein